MIGRLLSKAKRVTDTLHDTRTKSELVSTIAKMQEMRAVAEELRARFPESVALKGNKVYSQNDEDGIIAAIFAAIGGANTFLEIGVEDGRECNTHALGIQGWRGAWVEANAASAQAIEAALGGRTFPDRFKLIEDFARTNNIASIYQDICSFLKVDYLDFFSLDIDSNDLFVLDSLMASGARPTVVCVEYNGKFPPPMRVVVEKDETRGWAQDDYFGASLQSFYDTLSTAGYALIGCNLSGTNAFFVLSEKLSGLKHYEPIEAWQPLRAYLTAMPTAHLPTLKYMKDALQR